MQFNRDKHKRFEGILFHFPYTLPSSSTVFGTSNTALKMYNGTHTNSSSASIGSYYNARVANALTASTSVSIRDYSTNICPHNWTLPNNPQQIVVANYASDYKVVYAGIYYASSLHDSGSYGRWWSRTAYDSSDFYHMYASSGTLYPTQGNIYSGGSVRCLTIVST